MIPAERKIIMHEVMNKAQELAEAILDSEVYTKMHTLEMQMNKDEEAVKAMSDMIEKRQVVENILASADLDPDALAKASEEMEAAEKHMNDVKLIQDLKDARKEFSEMMNNVNRILRLVITGEVEDETASSGGCTGNCASCGGCSHE